MDIEERRAMVQAQADRIAQYLRFHPTVPIAAIAFAMILEEDEEDIIVTLGGEMDEVRFAILAQYQAHERMRRGTAE